MVPSGSRAVNSDVSSPAPIQRKRLDCDVGCRHPERARPRSGCCAPTAFASVALSNYVSAFSSWAHDQLVVLDGLAIRAVARSSKLRLRYRFSSDQLFLQTESLHACTTSA